MHRPPHPGVVLKETVIEPLALTVTQAAQCLGVDRKTLSRVLNAHAAVSVDMALRLAHALDTTPDFWLGLQQAHDVWKARREGAVDLSSVRRLDAVAAAL